LNIHCFELKHKDGDLFSTMQNIVLNIFDTKWQKISK